MTEQIKCGECEGTGMRDRVSRLAVGFISFVAGAFIAFAVTTVFLDDSRIGPESIKKAEAACKNNGGLEFIGVDIDIVYCINSAKFNWEMTDQ